MTGIILLAFGGRDYTDAEHVYHELDLIHAKTPVRLLIEGGCTGADSLARAWAEDKGIPRVTVHAQWEKLGRKAGPLRNSNMLNALPDLAVAFPGGAGTADMAGKCERAGVTVKRA
jgi:hypothetical protein